MIEIGIAYSTDPVYEDISRFARDVYVRRHGVYIEALPDAFSYVRDEDVIVGCFGIYWGTSHHPLLFETFFPGALLVRTKVRTTRSNLCAELGTRAVTLPAKFPISSTDVSIALSATIIIHAREKGTPWLCFTTNKSVLHIAKHLGFQLILIGKADLSVKDIHFQKNWRPFFRVPQHGFLLNIRHTEQCESALSTLKNTLFCV